MALGKRLINTGGVAACTTDSTDPFGDSSGVALYNLDYDASDASGSYDGTPSNVEFGVGGQINYGARFNGSSSNIDTNLKTQNVGSHSFWFKADANPSGTEVILASGYGSSNKGVNILLNTSGQIRLQINDGGGAPNALDITTSSSYADGNYHNIVATWDLTSSGTNSYLYVDNDSEVVSGSGLTSGWTSGDSTYDIFIGAYYNDSQNFDGDIDQVRIFNKALNSTEVSTLYAETACVHTATTTDNDFPTTNLAYYKLDNSAEDEKGNYDGTESNIEYRFGRYGQALKYSASTSSTITTPLDSTDLATNFSVSFWIKLDGLSFQAFNGLYSKSPISNQGWFFGTRDSGGGNYRFFWLWYYDTSQNYNYVQGDNINLATDTFYHVALSFTNGSLPTLYVNGVASNSHLNSTTTAPVYNAGSVFQIGSTPNTNVGAGFTDQVRLFNSALSSSQVTELYNEKPEVDTSNFKAVLYEGNASTNYISNVGIDLETNGGFVWTKSRTDAFNHMLYDSVRGATNYLASNNTTQNQTNANTLMSFEANGFFLGASDNSNYTSGGDGVSWVWKGGGDAVNIAVNSITGSTPSVASDVSANTEAGFSIVKWNGDGTNTQTVGHGLDYPPEIVIMKSLSSSVWYVLTTVISGTNPAYLQLESTAIANSGTFTSTSTTFTNFAYGGDTIAYCFHSVSGYSKIGTYTGATSGVTENIGFEPSMVIIKNATQSDPWGIFDNKRPSGTGNRSYLYPSTADDEDVYGGSLSGLTLTSTGFAIDNTNSHMVNQNGETYLYMAFK